MATNPPVAQPKYSPVARAEVEIAAATTSTLRREIVKDPAQKILPGQDLAPGRMPGIIKDPAQKILPG